MTWVFSCLSHHLGMAGFPTPTSWIHLLMFGPALLGFADGCFRQQTETPTTTTEPTVTEEETMVLCNEDQLLQNYCHHEGICWAEEIAGSTRLYCHCKAGYFGPHCEEIKVPPGLFPSTQQQMRTAHIAAGVAVCILVIFVILLAIYVWLRQKKLASRRQRRCLVAHDHNNKLSQSLPLNVETCEPGKDKSGQNGNADNNGTTYKEKPADDGRLTAHEQGYPLNGNETKACIV